MPAQDSGAADQGGRDPRRPGFLRAVRPDEGVPAEDAAETVEPVSTRQDGGLGIVQALALPTPAPVDEPEPDARAEPAEPAAYDEPPAPPAPPPPATPRHAAPAPEPTTPAASGGIPDGVSASREIFSALGLERTRPDAPRGKHAADPAPVARSTPALPVEAWGGDASGPSTDVSFPPRTGTRTIVGLAALVTLVAFGYAAYLAYDDPRFFTIGIAGTLLVVTLVLYGVRASSTPTRLAIRGGQLIVTRGSTRETFDLTSRYTRIEIVGKPGRRGWKVLFGRFGRDPFVVDASLVDPSRFDAALRAARGTEWRSRG